MLKQYFLLSSHGCCVLRVLQSTLKKQKVLHISVFHNYIQVNTGLLDQPDQLDI